MHSEGLLEDLVDISVTLHPKRGYADDLEPGFWLRSTAGQASFQYRGRELTRYHFAATLRRPFCWPVMGATGGSLTRMGHPHAPLGHSHHNSVWISHKDVGGVDFWGDHGENRGQIVHQQVEQYAEGYRRAMHEVDQKRVYWGWCWGDPPRQKALSEHPLILWWHTVVRMSDYHGLSAPPGPQSVG